MTFSILHISDLHQNLQDEIPPEWLLDRFESDFERFKDSDPAIPLPAICIVTGDIVYGVGPTAADAAVELERQYDQAHDLLVGLCDRFFGGDREKVILLPGNHDIDYSQVIQSGSYLPIPKSPRDKSKLVQELFAPNSALRWSWSKLQFFRIVEATTYGKRLNQFARMYERFYQGKRKYSLDPSLQYAVFDFPHLSFSLIALNSCHQNDPMNRAGAIHANALQAACRALSSPSRAGWCLGASWHHDVTGGAGHEDFLDAAFLQLLVEAGATIGFHGHRHRADCIDQKNRLGTNPRTMAVVAAGTLCAGPTNLTPGVPRGYNVVELDTQKLKGRVHAREMINQLQNLPIWGPSSFVDTNKSYVDFELSPPLNKRPAMLDLQQIRECAAEQFGQKKWQGVIEAVGEYADDPIARRFYVEALSELGDNALTILSLANPRSIAEAVILGSAILENGEKLQIQRFLTLELVRGSTDASLNEIRTRLKRKI